LIGGVKDEIIIFDKKQAGKALFSGLLIVVFQ